jgi:hypothetical protein
MAKQRDVSYTVPMALERAVTRLDEITSLGIALDITQIDSDHYVFHAQRLQPGRGGKPRVVETVSGQIRRSEDDLTRVEPIVRKTSAMKLILFYGGAILLGLILAIGIGFGVEGLTTQLVRPALAVLVVYVALFLLIQPQRLVGSANDERFAEFVHDVLSGPYADPANLYEQYFPRGRYWETHSLQ